MNRKVHRRIATLTSILFVLSAAIGSGATPAAASLDGSLEVQSPDEEDFLDQVPWLNPPVLPPLADAGLVHETVENLIPDVIDEWVDVSVGGCDLSMSGPSASRAGLQVSGSATYSCSDVQRVIKLTVCIQRRVADRWEPIADSCRPAVAVAQSSATKRTSTPCVTGTWRYRLYAAAASMGFNPNVDARAGSASRITCRVLGA